MPGLIIPDQDNNTLGFFKFYLNDGSGEQDMGTIIAGKLTYGKKVFDIYDGSTYNPTARNIFTEPPLWTVSLIDAHPTIMAILLGYDTSDVSAGTQAVSAEAVTLGLKDIWKSLSHGQGTESPISDVVVNGVGGTPTYVENTDYKVDYAGGRVAALTPLASTSVEIDYKYTTQDAKKISIGKGRIDKTYAVRAVHTFPDKETWTIIIYKANIISSFDAAFQLEPHMSFPFEISGLQDDTHSNEEFGYFEITT
jgi:hypothetical protein